MYFLLLRGFSLLRILIYFIRDLKIFERHYRNLNFFKEQLF
jgi:hypothetical protein